jgi:lysozyme
VLAGGKVQGMMTAGYGHTGPDVLPGMVVTQEQADKWLAEDVELAAQIVDDAIWDCHGTKIGPYQRDTLISFVFNVGSGRKAGTMGPGDRGKDGFLETARGKASGVLLALQDNRLSDVPLQLMLWVRSGNQVNPGLVNRRAAECGLWATNSFVASGSAPVNISKAPTVTQSRIKFSAMLTALASMGTISVGVEEAGRQLKDLVSQHVGDLPDGWAPQILMAIGIVSFAAAVVSWAARNDMFHKHGV